MDRQQTAPLDPPCGGSRPRRALVLALLLAVSAGCGGATSPGATPSPSAHHRTPHPQPTELESPRDAVGLRSALEMLLGEHVRLTVLLMRDRVGGSAERAGATADAVRANSEQLASAVEGLLGEEAGAAFGQLWAAHVAQLQDYAAGIADDDSGARDRAHERLVTTESDLGRLLSTAVGGRLTPEAAQEAVGTHVHALLEQADAFSDGRYDAAFAAGREAFSHMLGVAAVLSEALAAVAGLPVGDLAAPRRTLQSALSRLLAEHMGLTTETMRAAVEGAPELAAAGASLNANTTELAGAVGALYGADASASFLQLWAGHVDGLVAYAQARRSDDAQSRDAAQAALDDYAGRLAGFLSTATAQRLPAIELTAALTEHDGALTDQVDAYADEDYAASQQLATAGYRHMFALAQTLADAIGDEVAAGLPRGGAQTGAGGRAPG
jgi:hypothetical protein